MDGIRFIVDEKGRRTHVVIDLKKNEELWEEIQAFLAYMERKDEPLLPAEEVHKRLKKIGALTK